MDVIFTDKSTISFFLNSFHYQAQESNVVYIFQPLHNKAKMLGLGKTIIREQLNEESVKVNSLIRPQETSREFIVVRR